MSNVVGGLMSPPYEAFVNESTIWLRKNDKHKNINVVIRYGKQRNA